MEPIEIVKMHIFGDTVSKVADALIIVDVDFIVFERSEEAFNGNVVDRSAFTLVLESSALRNSALLHPTAQSRSIVVLPSFFANASFSSLRVSISSLYALVAPLTSNASDAFSLVKRSGGEAITLCEKKLLLPVSKAFGCDVIFTGNLCHRLIA